MKKTLGITLTELLIAMTIFSTVIAISSRGIITGLQGHRTQEATSDVQAKLRRVTEIVTQQMRGAVFGSITTEPYDSNANAVSFVLLNGSGGYPVIPHDSGGNKSFENSANLQILANVNNADELGLKDKQALMINNVGQAVVFNVGNVQKNGNEYKIRVVHPGCGNTIAYTPNTILFGDLSTVGISYDADSRTLFRKTNSGDAVPLAYDISKFQIDYIYRNQTGGFVIEPTPYVDSAGMPLKKTTQSGNELVLNSLRMTIEAQDPLKKITRSYTNQVDLVDISTDRQIRSIRGVTVCDN